MTSRGRMPKRRCSCSPTIRPSRRPEKGRGLTMSTTQKREDSNQLKQDTRDALHSVIAEQVLHSLGKPLVRHRVQVRSLWEDFFRVNILAGEDAASLKVANSYFLKTDRNGMILESRPAITRENVM